MNKFQQLEKFCLDTLDKWHEEAKKQKLSPAILDDEILERGEWKGKIEALCQVIDEIIRINKKQS